MLSASASQIELALPAGLLDGTASIQVTDTVSGAFSQMIGALTYGALSTDLLLLLQGAEPATPVGSAAANAIRVRTVAADGITPVSGATLTWSGTNGLQFSVCTGGSSCSVLSDEAGESSSWVTPTATGQSTITIALAPASYSPPQSQQATVVGTSSALDLVAVTPTRWVGQGATLAVPLTVQALNLGVPKANVTVNFAVAKGTASLSAGSGTTNASGFATITAQDTNQNADVQVSACVAPNNAPCQTFTLFSTPSSLWTLETVSGSLQIVPTGQSFQPLVVRVTDGSLAADPVIGVNVTFKTTLARVPENGMPVILGSSQTQVVSAQDGLASIVPSAGSVGPCDVFITVSAGQSTAQFQMESVAAIVLGNPPQNGHPKSPSAPRSRQFGAPTAALPSVPEMLFVFPQGDPGSEPAADSNASACPESPADDACRNQKGPAAANPESENSMPPPSARSKPAKAKAPKKAVPAEGDVDAIGPPSADIPRTDAKPKVQIQSQPSSRTSFPEDKRSCKVLAVDGPLF
jgi:hypothetical protein